MPRYLEYAHKNEFSELSDAANADVLSREVLKSQPDYNWFSPTFGEPGFMVPARAAEVHQMWPAHSPCV